MGALAQLISFVWRIGVPYSVSGNVALLGDAIRPRSMFFDIIAMTPPHQGIGIGGGQAIEVSNTNPITWDAQILSRLLTCKKTPLSNVTEVFSIYQEV
jgi:hypothetical protein